jgi:hypothetical protein
MSSSLPTTTTAVSPTASAGAAPPASGPFSSATLTPPLDPSVILTPAELTSAIRDLTQAVASIRTFLASPYGPPPPGPVAAVPPSPQPSVTPGPSPSAAVSNQWPSTTAHGVPINQIRFPPSPSPLPAWLATPVYTTAPGQPTVLQPPASPSASPFGGFAGYAKPYAGVDGHPFQGGPRMPTYSAPASSLPRLEGAYTAVLYGQQPPRYTKLEFASYDGTVDPLNWLNQCD